MMLVFGFSISFSKLYSLNVQHFVINQVAKSGSMAHVDLPLHIHPPAPASPAPPKHGLTPLLAVDCLNIVLSVMFVC